MKTKFKLCLFLLALSISKIGNSQTAPIRDKWDTVFKNPAPNVFGYGVFTQKGAVSINNRIILYGDTSDYLGYTPKSFLNSFNPTTNSLSQISFTKTFLDRGISSGAPIVTNTVTNHGYVFFGAKNDYEVSTDSITLYKLNTLTNVVTSEVYDEFVPDYREGISNLVFFSPATAHDSLLIFTDSTGVGSKIYKKQVNQTGIVRSKIVLPIDVIDRAIVFNNELYVAGRVLPNDNGSLFSSSNGLSFSSVNTPPSFFNPGTRYVTDMDTLNNELYFAVYDADGFFDIFKKNNAGIFNTVISGISGKVTSLKNYLGRMWFSYNSGGFGCSLCNDRPFVSYLQTPSSTFETISIDTIGRPNNVGSTFNLAIANNSLYVGGNYKVFGSEYGTFIYKFTPPQASFTPTNLAQVCLNTLITFSNTSLLTDSVRWIVDANYYAGTSNVYSNAFTTIGTHTLGLIAIAGTQKDTALLTFNVYSITASINGASLACESTTFQLTSNISGAVGALTYSWSQTPSFTTAVGSTSAITMSSLTPGAYSYSLSISDANACSAGSTQFTVTVQPSKDIMGLVTTSSLAAVSGSATLYRYEPFLTKFDSIATVSMDASGGYTFVNIPANTYLVKATPSSTTQQITYCPSALSWQTATQVNHGCNNNTSQNITIIDLLNIGTGPGVLAGTVLQGPGYGQRTNGVLNSLVGPIKGAVIKGGRNPGGNYFAEARTNAAGQYSFTNVPVCAPGESYFILVDIPGLDTNGTYHRVVTTNSVSFTNLDFVVDSAKVNPIGNFIGLKEFKVGDIVVNLYPNPANEYVIIDYELNQSATTYYEVVNFLGEVIISQREKGNDETGKHTRTIPTSSLESGIYFVKFRINESEKTIKLIIN
ncbi:MAG: T9SS type A sorting domain-containing protein [Bacteroidota bacterium]|nr:T9SS type A sorting domain-containing protein [Bacteroidota bacterium]